MAWLSASSPLGAAECVPYVFGLDPSTYNTTRRTFAGEALGQTFVAEDTLISRFTVWRYPNDIDAIGLHLFVTTVDTAYAQPRPITQGIVQDGPTVFIRDGPPGEPIRMDFIIDPPLRLPVETRGRMYAFFLQREACDFGESILIAKEPPGDAYPPGSHWTTGRVTTLPCHLRRADRWEDLDLIFEIEYCRATNTPVLPTTWGRIKTIYR